jgi:hypothetical protein
MLIDFDCIFLKQVLILLGELGTTAEHTSVLISVLEKVAVPVVEIHEAALHLTFQGQLAVLLVDVPHSLVVSEVDE